MLTKITQIFQDFSIETIIGLAIILVVCILLCAVFGWIWNYFLIREIKALNMQLKFIERAITRDGDLKA